VAFNTGARKRQEGATMNILRNLWDYRAVALISLLILAMLYFAIAAYVPLFLPKGY
jgi:hypothetical protein